MNRVLKIISLLISYPTKELQDELPVIIDILSAENLATAQKVKLIKLAENLAKMDLYDAQERYVLLFDRTRSLSLHLFEHVHGESRDRGQAMVDLKTMYELQDYEIGVKELPDHLPLFLEFVSVQDFDEAADLLGQIKHIMVALRERLKKRKSIYTAVFEVLEYLASGKVEKKLIEELLSRPDDDPEDLEDLDRIWEEEVVTFGGNAGEASCGPDRLRTQIRAASRKPDSHLPETNQLEN